MAKMKTTEGLPEKLLPVHSKKAIHRKRGGKVEGKMPHHRPDRRARGGATSDKEPYTAAGKMSKMPFEAKQAPEHDDHGEGSDRP